MVGRLRGRPATPPLDGSAGRPHARRSGLPPRGRVRNGGRPVYLAGGPPRDGYSAVVTAGAPGAGKSTALTYFRGDDLTGFRVLDPDIVKDHLIEQAVRDGLRRHPRRTSGGRSRGRAARAGRSGASRIDTADRPNPAYLHQSPGEHRHRGHTQLEGLPSRLAAELTQPSTARSRSSRSTPTGAPAMSTPFRAGGQAVDSG